jgi:hypothetical protein
MLYGLLSHRFFMVKLNATSGLAGAGTGASIGGSMGGPVGAGAGALLGGLLGLFSGQGSRKKISTLDQQQQELYNQYTQGVQGKGSMADLFNFNPEQATDVFNQSVADPAYQNFQENIIPGITGAFRGGNLQNSSYLGGALGKAGTDVQKNLDAQLAQMLQQGQQGSVDRRLLALRDILGQSTFAYEKPQASPFDSLMSGFGETAGKKGGEQLFKWLESLKGAA